MIRQHAAALSLILLGFAVALRAPGAQAIQAPVYPNYSTVFTSGELSYPCIRIPAILLGGDNQTLLAFAECRNHTHDGCDPHQSYSNLNGNVDICMKSSADNGTTWSPLRVLFRGANQPTPVWDRVRNQLVLNFNNMKEQNFQSVSTDYGQTWSAPVNLTEFLGSATFAYVGPGVGLQLSPGHPNAGRLLFIGHHDAYQFDIVWYSDDGGKTYAVSKTNFTFMDEAQLVELPNGQVMANMRNNHLTDCDCRAVALSNDGGASFEPLSFDPVLVSPVCQATIIRAKDDKIYFANPASKSERAVGTLRRSDDGHTWAASTSVWPDQYAYSCLTDVAVPNAVGLLFETNSTTCDGPSCRILFSIYDSSF